MSSLAASKCIAQLPASAACKSIRASPATCRVVISMARSQPPVAFPTASRRAVLSAGVASLPLILPLESFALSDKDAYLKNVFIGKAENYVQVMKEVVAANEKGKEINASVLVQLTRGLGKAGEAVKDPESKEELAAITEKYKEVVLKDVWAHNKAARDGEVDDPELKAAILKGLEETLAMLPPKALTGSFNGSPF